MRIPGRPFRGDAIGKGVDDGFDFSKLLEIVVAIGGPTGPEFSFAFDEIGFASGSPVASEPLPTSSVTLLSVYPNPASDRATVAFDLVRPQHVTIEVRDLLGRRVATLWEGEAPAGSGRAEVPTEGLAAGIYLIRLVTPEESTAARLTVSR